MSTKPRAHATKWTVVVGLDRTTVRLFADQAKAETERAISRECFPRSAD
jgi:hypothetical protein